MKPIVWVGQDLPIRGDLCRKNDRYRAAKERYNFDFVGVHLRHCRGLQYVRRQLGELRALALLQLNVCRYGVVAKTADDIVKSVG
jgi:hypothetical protein